MTDPTTTAVTPSMYGGGMASRGEPANLGDILERVLDRGIVIAGDIKVNLLDIELLTIKLRLLVVSVETARELGIDWWEHDPWLTQGHQDLAEENRQLRARLAALEEGNENADDDRQALGQHEEAREVGAGRRRGRNG